jgi:hypothetical protein
VSKRHVPRDERFVSIVSLDLGVVYRVRQHIPARYRLTPSSKVSTEYRQQKERQGKEDTLTRYSTAILLD